MAGAGRLDSLNDSDLICAELTLCFDFYEIY